MKTEQECFDITCQHLMTQGVPALGPDGFCKYHDSTGLKCAVGAWIESDQYDPNMEGNKLWELIHGFRAALPPELIEYEDMFSDLQEVHDEYLQNSLEVAASQLKGIAAKYDVALPACVTKHLSAT